MRQGTLDRSTGRTARMTATLAALVLLVPATSAWAIQVPREIEELENPHLWKPRTTSVTVFKNGLGFFMAEAEVSLRDGWCVAPQVPPAVFGTLAIFSLDEDHLVDIVGSGPGEIVDFDGRDAPKTADYRRARLEAAKNLRVELTYKYKESDRTAAGKLVSVGPEFIVLESDAGNYAVPFESITRLQILDLPIRIHVAGAGGKPPQKTRLAMAYLRKGITWVPEYTLQVDGESTAELTLRGTLVNEVEDLVHCDVNFVVGVPHFVHTEFLSPLAVGQAIRTIGVAVAPREVQTQIARRAAIVRNDPRGAEVVEGPPVVERPVEAQTGDLKQALGSLPKMQGGAGTDYTVYTKKDLTLRRSEKAIITLFVRGVSYAHIYRWDPPAKMRHFLRLRNDTDTAWTTGPLLAIDHGKPISEDLFRYVPRGGYGEVPVTEAINIVHEKTEREVDRELKAYSVQSTYFDLVTLEGRLELKNFEKRDVEIVITCPVPGKANTASDEGKLSTDATKLVLEERRGSVSWRLTIEPGEGTTLTYQYERYVRSRK